jgi:hypothetical protein
LSQFSQFDDASSNDSPATLPGYDPATGAVRTIRYAQKVWAPQFFKAISVPTNNATIVTSGENYNVSDFSKVRLFAKASGIGNIDLVLRLSLNGGFDYANVHTSSMGDGVKVVMTPLLDIGASHLKVGLFNKSAATQTVDVWGFLY